MTEDQNQRPRPQFGEYADTPPTQSVAEASSANESPDQHGDTRGQQGDLRGQYGEAQRQYGESLQQDEAQQENAQQDAASAPLNQGLSAQRAAQQPGEPDAASHSMRSGSGLGTAGLLPGVPHNLGVTREGVAQHVPQASASQPSTRQAPPAQFGQQTPPASNSSSMQGQPYRATPPNNDRAADITPLVASSGTTQGAEGAPTSAQTKESGNRADRIITIALLVLGAWGALQTATSLLTLGAQMRGAAVNIFEIDSFVLPQSVDTLGVVGAITMLSLYAVVLIFSIQRLRAKKLTFWVPLSAGVVSIILAMIFSFIAFSQSPELMEAFMQPDAMQQVLQYAETQGV